MKYIWIVFVKVKLDTGMNVIETARFAGVAPCSILAVNDCNEAEFHNAVSNGREIILPVSTPHMIRQLPYVYQTTDSGRIVKKIIMYSDPKI